jgi:uncharacterized protein
MGDHTEPPPGFDPQDVMPAPLAERAWRVVSLALDVSGTCNLDCRYCAEHATQPARASMSEEVLDAAWRLLRANGGPSEASSLRFGSGEPLLNLSLLRHVAQLTRPPAAGDGTPLPRLFLTTNGTLLTPDVRDWLVETGWHVKVSLDGPQSIHDAWRVRPGGEGTYATIVEAVADLAPRLGSRFSITAVLCRGADPTEVFASLASLGARRIELVPAASDDPAILPGASDVGAYRSFVAKYAERLLEDAAPDPPVLIRFQDRIVAAMGLANSMVGCGAGRAFLGVAPDGALYPCFRFIGLEPYRLGSLPEGPHPDAVRDFGSEAGRPWDRRASCRTCWAAPLCGGPCFAVAETFGPGDGEPLAIHCEYVRADAWAAAKLVQELRSRDPERLVSFLPVTLDL